VVLQGKIMSRWSAALGSGIFFFFAPGVVAGFIPWWISDWQMREMPAGFVLVRVVGLALIAAGIVIVLEAFARFAIEGIGTPAPVLPTQNLVIKGSYRFVRNPMYVAVTSVIFGQAALLADATLVTYGAVVWLCMHVFVLTYEEPTLRRTFGTDYETYCTRVGRWIPHWSARSR
jgi:protein-S-isoprenylcysteine O-methyltransferase Ste14